MARFFNEFFHVHAVVTKGSECFATGFFPCILHILIIATNAHPFATPAAAASLGVTLVSLEELFAKSHVVSIHTPWLPETEKMINGPLIRSMPQGATLINTSRGAVIDESDLCTVLAERSDITAILDVTHPEPPLPDSPLRTLENVVLTPHIAGSIGGEIARMGYWMKDELDLYLAGKALQHGVSEDMLARMA
jgi:phosphoglycerate dehydrogenase-like enzyme